MNNTKLKKKIVSLLSVYYEDYYRVQLGLIDWRERVKARLAEEDYLGEPKVAEVEEWTGQEFVDKRVLVVGAGTGAESIVFHKRRAKIYAVEPDPRAIEILRLKARVYGIPQNRFKKARAENLPFKQNIFDFVYCYTVLEHVQNVEKAISEMIRVCKIGGMVYILTPDYRFPFEGHYKVNRPGFSSKSLTKLLLWLKGRPTKFIDSVNFVNAPQLDRIFMRHNVFTYRLIPPWLSIWRGNRKSKTFVKFVESFGFGRDQIIFLKKLGGRK